jgi:hypothetical protein
MNTNRTALENYLDEQRRRSDAQRRQAAEQGLRRDKAAARRNLDHYSSVPRIPDREVTP